ncbi:glycogen synthase GlgA [Altererythrobacter fulvus]|uniref:glycogen synthase GlgA n=1 Tax=Caenibius fulvus TaxID=2126012 RepID=UPI003015F103
MPLPVLSLSSEAVPLIKTGGLADVAGALPAAVEPHGVAMTTMLPGYPKVLAGLKRAREVHRWDSLLGEPARLLAAKLGTHPLLVLDAPGYFSRDGSPYSDPNGKDWGDNWRRFAAFGRAAADVAGGAVKGKRFSVLHAHDWQAAMATAYLRFAPFEGHHVPSVMTIHNMAFQGYFPPSIFGGLGLPQAAWSIDGVESYAGVGFLKAGLQLADRVTTVSPSYAAEIRMSEFGMGLEGLVTSRGDRVSGILNGIDTEEWNPETDPSLSSNFTAKTLSKRLKNKRALEAEFGLEVDDGPLFIAISRLTWQKGMDVLPEIADHLVGNGARLALLGSGDKAIEQALHKAAARHPGRIAIRIGYDEALSHRMQGGGDAILIPSRFEPCGLTQLYGLAYGCVPVVARTGGLADTVIDANVAALAQGVATGVQFGGVHYHPMATAISRTIELYRNPTEWRRLQKNGMGCDFSWKRSGAAYAALYRQLAEG